MFKVVRMSECRLLLLNGNRRSHGIQPASIRVTEGVSTELADACSVAAR